MRLKLTKMTILAHISVCTVTLDFLIFDRTFASVFTSIGFLTWVYQLTIIQGYLINNNKLIDL
jgi:hypothetical protein